MTITNYTNLQSTITDFLNRDDMSAIVPTLIQLAEEDMTAKLKHWRLENRATAQVDGRYSALPADFKSPIRLHIEGAYASLDPISPSIMQDKRMANNDTTARPTSFAITQGELELFPTPDQTYDLEMYYHARLPALSAQNPTNAILTYFPSAYLYGALAHSAPYLREDPRLAVWTPLYQNAISAINADSEDAKYNTSGHKMNLRTFG